MAMKILLYFPLCFIPLALAVTEKDFKKTVVQELYPSLEEWSQSKFFEGEGGVKIHYRIYEKTTVKSRPLVIVPGWTEFSLKYIELAYDLIQQGFSPVYVLDHRGQGASGRLLDDSEKSYVENFFYYTKDLKTFLNTQVLPRHSEQKLYLMAHSMGGAVSLFYMMSHPHTFRSAVITAPMLKINIPERLQDLVLILSSWSQKILGHQSFLLSKRTKDISFSSKNFLNQSPARYEFNKYLENNHGFYIRGATLKWIQEAIEKSRILREQAHQISTPLLIFSAEKDRLVDSSVIDEFCQKVEHCEHISLKGAKHEILMEKDSIRDKVLEKIFLWFK